ncbi:MAG: enoyl-CoA hydratase/isomerase family protein [Desertimonas sp.]
MENWSTIRWEVADGVGRLTLNRPEQLNGMTNLMAHETVTLLRSVAENDDVAVVVVTGAGRAFCPGADLKHYTSTTSEPDRVIEADDFDVPVLLHTMPQVTIAAINGACAGAGLGWACACDLRYAVADAKLNTAFLDVAVAGDMGLPWSLPRLVGAGRARELSLLPRKLTGADAAAIGLVNEAFADVAGLEAAVAERASRLAGSAPLARRAMKAHYVAAETMSFADLVAVETEAHLRITQTDDCKEAFQAFVQKRQPVFQGH